jgi:hypothetical protein
MAAISGTLLWHCFMRTFADCLRPFKGLKAHERIDLDSHEYPVRTYADLVFRVYGSAARYLVLLFQAIQMLLNVAIILISNGESLSQVSQFRLCYAVCVVVWAIAGFLFGKYLHERSACMTKLNSYNNI